MEQHDLHHEFPELTDKIHALKVENNHFKKLFDEYHELNKQIHGIEANQVFTDEELNEMRKNRLHLKDELYEMLTK